MRDITLEDTFRHDFTTRAFATGIPTVLANTPVLSVLEENNATPITAGVSVSVDRASVVGLNEATIVATAANGYEAGKSYSIYISTGTVDSVSVIGEVVGQFTIDKTAKAIWDRILTGATHNIANSAGRRLRQIQESGGYTNGAVYLDTVGGTAGTTDFENGVDSKHVLSIADANTIATNIKLSLFRIAPNSSITFAATQDGQVFSGSLWTLALGGQQVNETHIIGAEVSGTCTGHVHMDHCHLGICSFSEGEFTDCGFDDTITITAANSFIFVDCFHEEDGAPSTLDFGSAVGASEVHIHGWKGALIVQNMDTGDVLHFSSAEGLLTLDSSNTAGTLNISGTPQLTDNSATVTVNDNRDVSNRLGAPAGASIAADLVAIKAQTDDIGVAGVGLTDLGGMSTGMKAEVNAEVDTALADMGFSAPRKNVALSDLSVFMVDSTDHVTPKTGLTLGVTRSLDGAAFGAGTGTAAEIASGMYQYDASQADMNADVIIFRFTGTAADDTFITIHTRA